jgi:hypothetical protein
MPHTAGLLGPRTSKSEHDGDVTTFLQITSPVVFDLTRTTVLVVTTCSQESSPPTKNAGVLHRQDGPVGHRFATGGAPFGGQQH